MTATFRQTMMLFTQALSRVPRIRKTLISSTMPTAGRLTMPPSHGQAVSACGRSMPAPARKRTKYWLQEMLTVMAATVYSSTRSQPIIQAMSSPIVA